MSVVITLGPSPRSSLSGWLFETADEFSHSICAASAGPVRHVTQKAARPQSPPGRRSAAPDRFSLPFTTSFQLSIFGVSLDKTEDLAVPGPTFSLGVSSQTLKGAGPHHQGLPWVPAHVSTPSRPSQLCTDGSGTRALLPRPGSWKHITSSASWDQDHSGHFPRRPNRGNGDILSAFAKHTPGWAEEDKASGVPSSKETQVLSLCTQQWRDWQAWEDRGRSHTAAVCSACASAAERQGLITPSFIQLPEEFLS